MKYSRRGKPLSERYDVTEDGCWLWRDGVGPDGYGRFRINKKLILAHRHFYESHHGTRIPPGMVIDHLCRRRHCVNPHHLQVVTPRENILRGNGASAINARKTECIHGHPLSGDNLHIKPNGDRKCRTCRLRDMRAHHDRQYAAYYSRYNAIVDGGS